MEEKSCFFEGIFSALIYMVFIVVIPVASVYLQLYYNDKTLYLTLFTTGFAVTYDYISLFERKICKRLWIEAVISIVCVVATSSIGVIHLLSLVKVIGQAVIYTKKDIFCSLILAVPVCINFIEFAKFIVEDFSKRFASRQESDNEDNNMRKLFNAGTNI